MHKFWRIQCLFDNYDKHYCLILDALIKCNGFSHLLLNEINIKHKQSKKRKIKCCDEKEEEKADRLQFESGILHRLLIFVKDADIIISDASFKTLQCILINRNKDKCIEEYLYRNFNNLCKEINDIIKHIENDFVKRKLLRLLFDIITNKENYDLMMEFLQNISYLQLYMHLMKHYANKSLISIDAYQ